MEKSAGAPTSAVVVAILLSLATLFIAGDACDGIPSVTWNMTCTMACKTPELYNVCKDILTKEALYISAMTVYASVVAKHATRSYDDTAYKIDDLIARGVPGGEGGERAAYQSCINRYATARNQMVGFISDMDTCNFVATQQEYVTAVGAVKTCGEKLSAGWPLVAEVAADLDVTMVAYNLGALILSYGPSAGQV